MKNNRKDFAILAVLLVTIVVVAILGAGYLLVIRNQNSPQSDENNTQNSNSLDASAPNELSMIMNGVEGDQMALVPGRSCEPNSSRCHDLLTELTLISPPFENNYNIIAANLENAGWALNGVAVTLEKHKANWNEVINSDFYDSANAKASAAFNNFSPTFIGEREYLRKNGKVAIVYIESYTPGLTESDAVSSMKIYIPADLSDEKLSQIYNRLKAEPEKILLVVSTSK